VGFTGKTTSFASQLLSRNVKRFRGGLVFKAHRWLNHSTLGSRVIKKKEGVGCTGKTTSLASALDMFMAILATCKRVQGSGFRDYGVGGLGVWGFGT